VIAFRALTGAFPFSGSMFDVTSNILGGPTPVASAIAPDLAPEIDAFFARAMARNIDRRFQSARELWSAFSVLSGHAILVTGTEMPRVELPDDDVTQTDLTTRRLEVTEIHPRTAALAADQGRPADAVPILDETTRRKDAEGSPPSVAPAVDQEVPVDATPLPEVTTQRRWDPESSPPPSALAVDQELAVDGRPGSEMTTQRRDDPESVPAPAADQERVILRPVEEQVVLRPVEEQVVLRPLQETLVDATSQPIGKRSGRALVLVVVAILVMVAVLVAVASRSGPHQGSGLRPSRASTSG
jgi:hypothetical protein